MFALQAWAVRNVHVDVCCPVVLEALELVLARLAHAPALTVPHLVHLLQEQALGEPALARCHVGAEHDLGQHADPASSVGE